MFLGFCDVIGVGNGSGIVVVVIGVGEIRVCFGIVFVKVWGKSNN